jgi:hypothetical protein
MFLEDLTERLLSFLPPSLKKSYCVYLNVTKTLKERKIKP